MNSSDFINADHRFLAGLIGQVWSTNPAEQSDPVARENAEMFIHMYMAEMWDLHRTDSQVNNETSAPNTGE